MGKNPFLVIICGPTASGKTSMSIALAKYYGTEIISADSRQFYKELMIGTAKPTTEECAGIKHHFIDSLSINEKYSAGDYEKEAIQLIEDLFKENEVLIMVGGSGLFIDAVCYGLDDFPAIPDDIRHQLVEQLKSKGLDALQDELESVDPEYYYEIDVNNPRRVIRALEVFKATGKPFSFFHKRKPAKRTFEFLKIALDWDRQILYERINARVDNMLEAGLLEEVKGLIESRHLNALQTVGYTELFGYLDNEIDLEEAVRLIKRNTRRYAKRQLTWMRKRNDVAYIDPDWELEKVIELIESNRG